MGEYRGQARAALERAKRELATGDELRIPYAALELRMAMEAITYDRAAAYGDEFPVAEYETWQPKKVLQVLRDLDPKADRDTTLSLGLEPPDGQAPAVMRRLGTDRVLDMATLKKNYDALGSMMHVPTLAQRRRGPAVDHAKRRRRCEALAASLATVLDSPVYNATFGTFCTFDCAGCGGQMRWRFPSGEDVVEATCRDCGTMHALTDLGGGRVRIAPRGRTFACAHAECARELFVPEHQVEAGRRWSCVGCGGVNTLSIVVVPDPSR